MNEQTHEVALYKLPALKAQFAKLAKRAKKLNLDTVTLEVIGQPFVKLVDHYIQDGRNSRTIQVPVKFIQVSFAGELPRIGGWSFVARVESTVSGKAIVKSFKESTQIDENVDLTRCDHCNISRRRNSVFVIERDGEQKQIGGSCLDIYCGEKSLEQFVFTAGFVQFVTNVGNEYGCDDQFRKHNLINVKKFLACVVSAVNATGYVRADSFGGVPTRDAAAIAYEEGGKNLTEKDYEAAQQVIDWAKTIEPNNDYIRNVQVLCAEEYVEPRQLGILASALQAYHRATRVEESKNGVVSVHVGEVGKRQDFTLVFKGQNSFDSEFGITHLYRFTDLAGNVLTWFSSVSLDLAKDEQYQAKATVKEHGEYRGTKQTRLTRVKFSEKVA